MKKINIKLVVIILFAIVILKILDYSGLGNIMVTKIENGILSYSTDIVESHFGMIDYNKNDNPADEFVKSVNGNMYGIEYIIKEGIKNSLVSYEPVYLTLKKEAETEKKEDKKENNKSDKVDSTVETSTIVKPENGITYSMEQLSDFNFLISNMYIVPTRAKVLDTDLVAEEMLKKDMTIKGSNDKPQILIYHTHSQEAFADSVPGENMTIVDVGSYLAKLLSEKYGFNVIHCTQVFDMTDGVLDRSNSYNKAFPAITQILEDNPSIEVTLDIHRDGLPEGVDKLVTNINGKDTAKIMFFNGVSRSSEVGEIDYLYNRYRDINLALSFQMKLKAMEYYPDFTRKNYIDAYQYNLHINDKAMLIEVGAQNNTFAEAKNAMEPLSDILYMVFAGK